MVTLNDRYLPAEGINFSYAEIENCEMESRPSQIWFKGKSFWFRKRDWLKGDSRWVTQGSILASELFQQKITTYTDDWFVYTFDWLEMEVLNSKPSASIAQSTSDTSLDLNQWASLEAQWQEFTTTEDSVLRSITVRLRSSGTLWGAVFVRCRVTTAADKDTIIETSSDFFPWNLITNTFGDFTFRFNNVYIPGSTQYFFYIEAEWTSNAWFLQVQAQTGNVYAWWISFSYDGTNWNTGTDDLRFSIDMTGKLPYSVWFDDDVVPIQYLWGGRFPDNTLQVTVDTYNNANGQLKFTANLPAPATQFVNKYVYINSGTWVRQYWVISWTTAADTLTVNIASTPFEINPVNGDTAIFYNSIEQQLLFPRLRQWLTSPDVNNVYSRSRTGQNQFWFFPLSSKILFFDNRIVTLSADRRNLLFHHPIHIELPLPNLTVSFGNAEALNVAPYGPYLVVFFANKIWLVRKTTNPTTNAVFYLYQDLVSDWLYSKNSFLIKASDLFVFTTDKRLYAVDIDTLTINELSADLKDQWVILDNYFKAFEDGGDVSFNFVWGILRLVYKRNNTTEVYKYSQSYEVWIRDTYDLWGNLFNWLYNLNDRRITAFSNQFVTLGGITDLGQPIKQRIKVYWPEEWAMATFTLLKTKLRIGFDYENQIWWVITVAIGGYKLDTKIYNLASIDVIQEINQVIWAQWLIWEPLVGQYTIWWEAYSKEQIRAIYPEFIDVWFNVGSKWQYFTIEVLNDENKQLYLSTIMPIYNTESDLVISNKGVIPRE